MNHPTCRSTGVLRHVAYLLVSLSLALACARAQDASDGVITGRVFGESSGQYLTNARVTVRWHLDVDPIEFD